MTVSGATKTAGYTQPCDHFGGAQLNSVVDLVSIDDELEAVADEEDEHHRHQHRRHRDVPLLSLGQPVV